MEAVPQAAVVEEEAEEVVVERLGEERTKRKSLRRLVNRGVVDELWCDACHTRVPPIVEVAVEWGGGGGRAKQRWGWQVLCLLLAVVVAALL